MEKDKSFNIIRDLRSQGMRGVDQLVRHSMRRSEDDSIGSNRYQHNQRRFLARFNLENAPLQVFDIVESADEDAEREGLKVILQRIENGQTGVLLVGYGSRLSRDEEFGAKLIKTAERMNVHFVVGGTPYNPRIPDEHAKLMDMIVTARRENAERKRVLLTGRYHKALENALVIPVPTGLIFADPSNPAYLALLEKEGLAKHVTKQMLKQHQICGVQEHSRLYVLPDPFKDVYRACQMVTQWMLDTMDPTEVLHRIRTDDSYPRKGLFPVHRSYVFGKSNGPKWAHIDATRLYCWFKSPALYGVYVSRAKFLDSIGEAEYPQHELLDAFPSLMRREDRDAVRDAFQDPKRKFVAGQWGGPRTHLLAKVRCAERRRDGTLCNGKISVSRYRPDGSFQYKGMMCHRRGHKSSLPCRVDTLVLQVLQQVFRPEHFAEAAGQLQRLAEDSRQRRAELRALLEGLDEDIEFFTSRETAGWRAGDEEEETLWKGRRLVAMDERRARRVELQKLDSNEARVKDLRDEEYDRIRRLAIDVPELLRCACEVDAENVRKFKAGEMAAAEGTPPAFARRIVSHLVRAVRIKHLARGAYTVQIVFPSGASVTRVLLSKQVAGATQVHGCWITGQLNQARDPASIAADLETAHAHGRRRPWKLPPWTADRVKLTALHHQYAPAGDAAAGTYETVSGLAERVGESPERVLAVALCGRLGPAVLVGDEIALSPSLNQLHREFKDLGRLAVARAMGWPESDTILIAQASKAVGTDYAAISARARSSGSGIGHDANKRVYVRFSEVRSTDSVLDNALRNAPVEIACLSREYWIRGIEVRKRFPNATQELLQRIAPSLRAGKDRWFHIPQELQEQLYLPTLEEAASDLGVPEDDFLDHRNLTEFLRERFSSVFAAAIRDARENGNLTRIPVRDPKSRHSRLMVLVPKHVRESRDPAVARAWLQGRL